MAKHTTIDAYIAALPESVRDIATAARGVIDAHLHDASSAIKWAHPTWSIDKQPICYLKAASRHITFGFWRGAKINDPSGRLETSGTRMAHAKLRSMSDVDHVLFADWLEQARAFESAASGAQSDAP